MDQWKSDEIGELMGAVAKAQAELKHAKKDAANPFFKSKYADLPAVWEALAPFRANGLALVQCPAEAEPGHIALETILAHSSGQWVRSRLVMKVAKDDPQGAGSALTYARRYALGCMTGLVTDEDDDGNAASHPPKQTPYQSKMTAQAKINELRREGAAPPTPPGAVSEPEPSDKPDVGTATVPTQPAGSGAPSFMDEASVLADYQAAIEAAEDSTALQKTWDEIVKDARLNGQEKASLYKPYQAKAKGLKRK